jgi:hypothetical protein
MKKSLCNSTRIKRFWTAMRPVPNQQYFLKYEAPRTHEGGGDGCMLYFYWWLRGINTPRREGGTRRLGWLFRLPAVKHWQNGNCIESIKKNALIGT